MFADRSAKGFYQVPVSRPPWIAHAPSPAQLLLDERKRTRDVMAGARNLEGAGRMRDRRPLRTVHRQVMAGSGALCGLGYSHRARNRRRERTPVELHTRPMGALWKTLREAHRHREKDCCERRFLSVFRKEFRENCATDAR